MITTHDIKFNDSRNLEFIDNESIDLIVTSPPYPMIEQWDDLFVKLNPSIISDLKSGDGLMAYGRMHQELDRVWEQCCRVLKKGGIICINIGDAVRTIGNKFQLFPNHARIINKFQQLGLTQLPDILWRKQTNAPNKFMGSGMLPTSAYVTYEHEYILIFRKGNKRNFSTPTQRSNRRTSAFFWEERNQWFSDIWLDVKGTKQQFLPQDSNRIRSGAFPFELAYRLICMYSVYNDMVLDPFLGTGTTTAAAIASGRNSIGVEIDDKLDGVIRDTIHHAITIGKNRVLKRISDHEQFINQRKQSSGRQLTHFHSLYNFGVMTSQETDIRLYFPQKIISENKTGRYSVCYQPTGADEVKGWVSVY